MSRLDFLLLPYFVYIEHFTKFTRESFLLKEKSLLMENQKRKKVVGEEKKKKKKGSKKKERVPICQKRESTNLSRKERELPSWKRLVLAELHAGVQILNKEVAVKPKFTIHNVKNEVSFYFCKYQPWYNNINACLESQFWKLYVDSLFCSSAHFAVFPFLPRVFPSPLGTLLIIVSSST